MAKDGLVDRRHIGRYPAQRISWGMLLSSDMENRMTALSYFSGFAAEQTWLAFFFVLSSISDIDLFIRMLQIAMGTFIVSFIGNSFVTSAASLPQLNTLSPQRRRRILVLVYYTFIILLFTLFGVLIIPDVVREGYDFVSRLQTENLWVVVLEKMRKGLGYG